MKNVWPEAKIEGRHHKQMFLFCSLKNTRIGRVTGNTGILLFGLLHVPFLLEQIEKELYT